MTVTRLVIILMAGLLITDHEFGNGRLVDSMSTQAVELGYSLESAFTKIVRRISP
jgi:hypothetical protein